MVKMKNVSFQYESAIDNAGIYDINLEIGKGEVVIICGESGCGKTTLTRLINGLVPHYFDGKLSGEVLIDGKEAIKIPLYETAKRVGSVFQNPRSQFFSVDTNSELAFACENQGLPVKEIDGRIEKTVKQLQIDNLMGRSIFELSGGEKQKIACGSVYTADTDIVALDEPSSNLDAKATADLAQIIAHWKRAGKTIIIAEHRLYYLNGIADRMIFMREGKIEQEFDLSDEKSLARMDLSRLGLRTFSLETLVPEKILGKVSVNDSETSKRDQGIGEIRANDNNGNGVDGNDQTVSEIAPNKSVDKGMELRDFHFKYKSGQHALDINSLELPRGQIIAVIGENGAGKSTFARCLCGLPKRFKGKVRLGKQSYQKKRLLQGAYMVMQDVNHQLFTESVLDEVMLSMKLDDEQAAEKILEHLNLLAMKDRHPMSLSGGQKQRVAIASALASEREVIIFDEPTSGLDLKHMKQVSKLLRELKEVGKTIFIISHDMELILRTCNHVLYIENGRVKEEYGLQGNEKKLSTFFEEGFSFDVLRNVGNRA